MWDFGISGMDLKRRTVAFIYYNKQCVLRMYVIIIILYTLYGIENYYKYRALVFPSSLSRMQIVFSYFINRNDQTIDLYLTTNYIV